MCGQVINMSIKGWTATSLYQQLSPVATIRVVKEIKIELRYVVATTRDGIQVWLSLIFMAAATVIKSSPDTIDFFVPAHQAVNCGTVFLINLCFCVVLISLAIPSCSFIFIAVGLELLVFVTDIVPYASPKQKANLKLEPESN